MNGSSGRVNPSQFPCGLELLGTELPTDEHLRIRSFCCEPVKTIELNEGVLWELRLQPRTKPFRRIPELEAMMDGEEDFHENAIGNWR